MENKYLLIIGNGSSRLFIDSFIRDFPSESWVCNKGYTEFYKLKNCTRVLTVHKEIVKEAKDFRESNSINFVIVSNCDGADISFLSSKGWCTGNLAIVDALELGYTKIYLAGFDMGGPDIYQSLPVEGSNFIKQLNIIREKYDISNIFGVNEKGTFPIDPNTDISKNAEKRQRWEKKRVNYYDPSAILNKRILIVGNSPKVLLRNYRNYIDNNFDIIVRINDYVTEGYEDKIGSNTSIWFSGASKFSLIKSREDKNIEIIVGLSNGRMKQFLDIKTKDLIIDQIKKSLDFSFSSLNFIPIEIHSSLRENTSIRNPTTGFLCLYYFIEFIKCKNITIYGFDFFDNKYHYYDKDRTMKVKLSPNHNNGEEKKIILNLRNKIKFLEENILNER